MTAHLQSGDKTLCGMRAGTAYLTEKLENVSCFKCLHVVIKELKTKADTLDSIRAAKNESFKRWYDSL